MTAPLLPPTPAARWPVNPPSDPPGNARIFLDAMHMHDDRWTLLYHRQQYLWWTGTNWATLAADVLEQRVSWFFENAEYTSTPNATATNPQPVPVVKDFVVNSGSLNDLMRAIRNKVIIDDKINFNTWLEPRPDDPPTDQLVPLQNGLLNTSSRALMPSTPRFFNTYALTFDYDAAARNPQTLFAFMRSVFGGDSEREELVQEMIGYLTTPRQDQQKMFNLIGPPRCGKGTLARLVEKLVGDENYGSTSLTSLGDSHGLEGLVTKPVVVLGDAAHTGRNGGLALERLLGIIGEDRMDVNPKSKTIYSAKLPCRFILLANNLPVLPDSAQALRARWLVLRFTKSFLGAEDRQLGDKLSAELPAIFNWALDGLDRLQLRGEFKQPEIGNEDMDAVTRLTAPATAFMEDCCITSEDDPTIREASQDVWQVWQNWCLENGVRPRSRDWMGRMIRETTSGSHVRGGKMPRDETGKQAPAMIGLRLTGEARQKYLMSEGQFKLAQDGLMIPHSNAAAYGEGGF